MKKLHFETVIDAPRQKVWSTMLEPETYEDWTSAFTEGSRYEGSWEKGEEIRFLGPDGSGMLAVIADNRPHEFVSIKHVGMIMDGVEDRDSEQVRKWTPAYENYRFSEGERPGTTNVEVEMDVAPDYEQDMKDAWPKALERLKQISEGDRS